MKSDDGEWKVDKHVSTAVIVGFVAQTLFGAIWIGWWGSSYNSQLVVLTSTVAELRLEQRQIQTQMTATSALSDKRLALLETAVPEIKQFQSEIREDLKQLSHLLNEYISIQNKRSNGVK